jgi:hypothetical protein
LLQPHWPFVQVQGLQLQFLQVQAVEFFDM